MHPFNYEKLLCPSDIGIIFCKTHISHYLHVYAYITKSNDS